MSPIGYGFVSVLGAALIAQWLVPPRWRGALLLGCSYVGLGTIDARLPLVAGGIAVTGFALTECMRRDLGSPRRSRLWIALLVGTGAGLLGWLDELTPAWRALGPHSDHPVAANSFLGLGAGFQLLQAMSYGVDVRCGRVPARASAVEYGLLLGFLPKAVAGPTVECAAFLKELRNSTGPEPTQMVRGMRYVLEGLVLKTVVANRLAAFNDPVFAGGPGHYRVAAGAAAALFLVQFVAEVAGYLRMARGTSLMFGIDLGNRVEPGRHGMRAIWAGWYPEMARWWNLQVLSTLRGVGLPPAVAAIAAGALLGGWHRAEPAFCVIGAYFGMLSLLAGRPPQLRLDSTLGGRLARVARALGLVALGSLGLVCLRLESVTQGTRFMAEATLQMGLAAGALSQLGQGKSVLGPMPDVVEEGQMVFPILILVALGAGKSMLGRMSLQEHLERCSRQVRWTVYGIQILAVLIFGRIEGHTILYAHF